MNGNITTIGSITFSETGNECECVVSDEYPGKVGLRRPGRATAWYSEWTLTAVIERLEQQVHDWTEIRRLLIEHSNGGV